MKEAMYYEKCGDYLVNCNLCGHRCPGISDLKRGICGVRENRGGSLYSLVYGKIIARAVDPIEKKPLFHFLPGSSSYSIATVGCNFKCGNCQNFEISQTPKEHGTILGQDVLPEDVVMAAKLNNCESIAYTYSEPTVFFEYAYDTAKLASKEGIKNIFVTNGYISEEPLAEIKPYLDAANIDLKSFSDDFYRRNCGARLDHVLDSIRLHKSLGIWLEVTTLIIPNLNDSDEELRKIATFLKAVDEGIPWHISRFYPRYELIDAQMTPIGTLRRAKNIGLEEGLKYVYEGNVPGEAGENTYCYHCNKLLVRRYGYQIRENLITHGRCPDCGSVIDGFF